MKIGRGWWRTTYDWETDREDDPNAFLQKIVSKGINNPFSVYPDPSSQEIDYSDMNYCFVTEDVDVELFKQQWGPEIGDDNLVWNAPPPQVQTSGSSGDRFQGLGDKQQLKWFPKGAVRVAEYWYTKREKAEIALLENGKVMPMSEVPNGIVPVGRREVWKRSVHGALITGAQILKRWDWKGKWIPIIGCVGKRFIYNDKTWFRGMIRPAMDANLGYDYMASKEVEAIALAPISQWLVAHGQLEGYEFLWADSNRTTSLTTRP